MLTDKRNILVFKLQKIHTKCLTRYFEMTRWHQSCLKKVTAPILAVGLHKSNAINLIVAIYKFIFLWFYSFFQLSFNFSIQNVSFYCENDRILFVAYHAIGQWLVKFIGSRTFYYEFIIIINVVRINRSFNRKPIYLGASISHEKFFLLFIIVNKGNSSKIQ